MKYKERIATTIVITLLVLLTLLIYERHDKHKFFPLLDDSNQCHLHNSYMTADWTVDSIYDDLNFTLNTDDGLYTVIEKTKLHKDNILHSEPLKIIVVPHSHNDPGWLWTFEDYYTIRTRNILTNTISSLKRFPEFRMIWTETVFLERWWEESPELLRSEFRDLVRNGKIEILSGGWVSVDEATTHYTAVLDQLIEGHLWIKQHFGVFPNTSWSIDPFGYSSSLPYLWKKSGMKNMAILRIHGAVKGYMGNRKMLTYNWRQPWDAKGEHDILCHVEPYTLYNIECSCGPDTEVCNVLDFSSRGGFPKDNEIIYFGKNRQAKNFEEIARLVVEQYKKKAALYNHNVIMMPHGDDFRYIEEYDFEVNYKNMKKIMDYINSRSDWNVEMKFGTVGDYFETLRSEMRKHKSDDVSLTGDFFTYTDKENDYWSGYFSTRPFDKRMIRELLEYLRTTEAMTSLIYVYLVQNTRIQASDWQNDWKAIAHARRTHGLVQHHDAITGTSTTGTVMDFEIRIHEAINGLINILQNRVSNLLMPGTNTNIPDLKMTRELPSPIDSFEDIMLRITDKVSVVFINSHSKQRREVIRLSVNTNDIEVFDSKNNMISFQISPLWSNPDIISTHGFETHFEIDVPAIGLSVYTIKRRSLTKKDSIKSTKKTLGAVANIFSLKGKINNANKKVFTLKSSLEHHSSHDGIFSIENQYLKLSFLSKNGALQTVCVKSSVPHCVQVKIQFFRYFGNGSNAYCFNSDGEEEQLQPDIQSVTLVKGIHLSQVRIRHKMFTHVVTLYNTSSLQGHAVHIDNIATLQAPDDHYTEFMMRFNTDIHNLGTRYFTDSNGFQLVSRKLRKNLPIGANFYPFTSMAVIEDTETRLTLHTAQPHGIGSLSTGSLEVMLDRVPMSTGKGLEEAVTDNKPAASKFIIQIERVNGRHINTDYRKYQVYPSLTSHMINDLLQSPIVSLFSAISKKFYFKDFTFLETNNLPCDISIANLRSILTENANLESTGLTLHKRITSCSVKETHNTCSDTDNLNLKSIFKHLELVDVRHMSLSHLYELNSPSRHKNNIIEPMELESYQYRWKL